MPSSPTAIVSFVRHSAYTIEDGFPQQVPAEYVRAQNFIREVPKGCEKHATAAFFDIPDATSRSILNRAKANYDLPFDTDQWRLERATVEAGEKELPPLNAHGERQTVSPRRSE